MCFLTKDIDNEKKLKDDLQKSTDTGEDVVSRVSYGARSVGKQLMFWIFTQGVLIAYRSDERLVKNTRTGKVSTVARCSNRFSSKCKCSIELEFILSSGEMTAEAELNEKNWRIIKNCITEHVNLNGPGRAKL